MSVIQTKLIAGNRYVNTAIEYQSDEIKLKFGFNRNLLGEVKAMTGARWNPEGKFWTVSNNDHNHTALHYLMGEDVFARYNLPLESIATERPLREHQLEMLSHGLTRQYAIWAVEMGCGKTLSAIELMERSNTKDWWYVAPKSALASVELEFEKWDFTLNPRMMTYEGLKKIINKWKDGDVAPQGVVYDESSRIKNHSAQRSQAAKQLADGIRSDWGDSGFVLLMSGSPAPKSPVDWWHQAEVAFPGFIKEGTEKKLKTRLAIIQGRDNGLGQKYPHLIGWKDTEGKCGICGKMEDAVVHNEEQFMLMGSDDPYDEEHVYTPCINEVEHLYERLEGLVLVKNKKDCLDLPDKQYQIIRVEPDAKTWRLAKFIINNSKRAIEAMCKLRELSDGFQYSKEELEGEYITCPTCKGEGGVDSRVSPETNEADTICEREDDNIRVQCPKCGGVGNVPKMVRSTVRTRTPKDDALLDLLDQHEDIGRIVISAGFKATIDGICELVKKEGWNYINISGGACRASFDTNYSLKQAQSDFQRIGKFGDLEKIAIVMQPKSGGMGLTLTESPSMVYYSNDFDAEARIQSEDRIHRMGMDENRGATIYDIVHLPTDELVIENLQAKRSLQSMNMGEFQERANAKIMGQ